VKEDDLIDVCIRVQRDRLGLPRQPVTPDEREAMRSVLRVAATKSPGVAAHVEANREPDVIDELLLARLRARARPYIDAIVREANVEADITAELLTGPCTYPWLVAWRDKLCWLLSRKELMPMNGIGAVLGGRSQQAVSLAVGRYEKRRRAAAQAASKEVGRGSK